jgi:hypothetical protein
MAKGTVFHCVDFEFKNGEEKSKYLVQLNEPEGDEPYIVCKTTSNSKNKRLDPPCQPKVSLFALRANHDFFRLDTWLQLYDLYEIVPDELVARCMSHRMQERHHLRAETIGAIVNCIRICEDVGDHHRSLICRKR